MALGSISWPEVGQLDGLLVRVNRQTIFMPRGFAEEQLGLVYVATAAERAGYRVAVLDEPGTNFARISDFIRRCGVSVVGFYVDHENIFTALSLMSMLKEAFPRVLFVTGGPQSKEWHRRIISDSACDIATRGEGERVFVEILDYAIGGRGSLNDIRGITWRDEPAIVVNPEALPIELDLVPIPNRALNPSRVKGAGVESIMTGRGCPFRCAFCYEGRLEAKYRKRSMENIMEEVEHLIVDRGVRYLVILDDVFLLSPKHAVEFARRLRKLCERYNWDLSWFCEARADVICRHPDMLAECIESGLSRVQVGVETGNQAVLDKYNKRLKVEETVRAVELCAQHDILSVIGNFIIGGADETWETVEDSIGLAQQLLEVAPGRMDVNSTIFTPYPGTPMYEYPENFGIELLDPDCLTGPGDNYPFHRTKGLGRWEIVEARQRFLEAVEAKMYDVMPSIPVELAERHFRAFTDRYLRTNWFDFMARSFNWYNYIGLPLADPSVRRFHDVSEEELWRYKPQRTLYLGTTVDGRFMVNAGHRRIVLDTEAGALLELCAGKLTLRQVELELHRRGIPVSADRIRDLLQSFDSDRLLVFSPI